MERWRASPLRRLSLVAFPFACALVACTSSQRDGATARPEIAPTPSTSPAPVADASVVGALEPAPAPSATLASPLPKPGMAWIPAGILRAGTPPDRAPRIPEEELPGTPVAMGGFYIDVLPYPNEPGAIPTTNVTRDEAARMCSAKGKRLCTELEWERACKGPANTTYEYGDTYQPNVCGTGVSVIQSARRPAGERVTCKSGFGVVEMHGGAWEWTDSTWRRENPRPQWGPLYVLRGGNSEAGELAGRCANALARRGTMKGPTMGFRCCSGPKNDPDVELENKRGIVLERSSKPAELAASLVAVGTQKWGSDGAGAFVTGNVWTWHPVANEELRIVSGCAHPPDAAGGARCGVIVARTFPDESGGDAGVRAPQVLAQIDSGHQLSEVVLFGNPKLLRMWGVDARGSFVREFGYSYGRVDVGEPKRH